MSEEPQKISADERQRRREAVDHAQASIGLSGFTLSQSEKELAERYVKGDIELDEYIAMPHGVEPNL